MRKPILVALILCFIGIASGRPKGDASALSEVDRLYYTCKVWGFLKYYHPKVGNGAYDWDQKLLSVLKNTANIQSGEQLSTYLSRWIYAFGPRAKCTSCRQEKEDTFTENFDLSWTSDAVFSDDLQRVFFDVENNRFQGDHHYISKGKSGQFIPKNEATPEDYSWKERYHRLLPLFRYWNYIEYFFPYKYQTEQQWDKVLKEMIPIFLNAQTKLDYHLAMLQLVVKIDDSHGSFMTSTLEELPYFNYFPIKFEIIEEKVVITEIIDNEKSAAYDLRVGDIIETINAEKAEAVHERNKRYIWGSNGAAKDRNVSFTLLMGLADSPEITIKRNSETRTFVMPLYKFSDLTITKAAPEDKWRHVTDSIAYVDLGRLKASEVQAMMDELMEKTVLIFDVRNNPKGTYRYLAKYLNPRDTAFAALLAPDFSYPGKFTWTRQSKCGKENADYFKGKVILLVNEKTQSQAEYTCMCLQTAPNVLTIGSQTAGADGSISKIAMIQRYYTSFTGTGVFYPDRQETQRIGIRTDLTLRPTISGIAAGRDEVYEKAVELAQEEVKQRLRIELALRQQQLDSLAADSLLINMPEMDSLSLDSISTDKKRDY